MASIVDPHVGFVSFKQAVKDGDVTLVPCAGYSDLFFMTDNPEDGEPRLTYGRIVDGVVQGYAVYVHTDPLEGNYCFSVGYATDIEHRGKGVATQLLKDTMQELYKGMQPHLGEHGLCVDALVGLDNPASQRVAAKVFDVEPERTSDNESGEPALWYVKQVQ